MNQASVLLICSLLFGSLASGIAHSQQREQQAPSQTQTELVETRKRLEEADLFADPPAVLAQWKEFRESAVEFYGEQHPEVGIADSNLAAEWFLKGDVSQARQGLYNALEKLEAQPDRYRKQIKIIQNNLGVLALELGEGSEALRLIEPLAQNLFQGSSDAELSHDLATLNNLAQAQLFAGRPDLGEITNKDAIKMARKLKLISRNPTLLTNEPLYLGHQGRMKLALAKARKNLAELSSMAGAEARRAKASLLSSMAVLLVQSGKNEAAIEFGRKGVDEFVALYGEDAPVVGRYLLSWMTVLLVQGQYNSVYSLAKESIDRFAGQETDSVFPLQAQEYYARAAMALDPNTENLKQLRAALEALAKRPDGLVGKHKLGWLDLARAEETLISKEQALKTLKTLMPEEAHQTQSKNTDSDSLLPLIESEIIRLEVVMGNTQRLNQLIQSAKAIGPKFQDELLNSGLEARMQSHDRRLIANAIEAAVKAKAHEEAFVLAQLFVHSGTHIAKARAKLRNQPSGSKASELLESRQALVTELSLTERQRDNAILEGLTESAATLSGVIKDIEKQLATVTKKLEAILPGWQTQENASSYSLLQVQKQLDKNALFAMPLVTGGGVALFAVTKEAMLVDWLPSSLLEIADNVAKVKQSIALSGLIRSQTTPLSALGEFDYSASYGVYSRVFTSDFTQLLQQKQTLFTVNNDSVSTLPLSILVSNDSYHNKAEFLIDKVAISTLPNIATLFAPPTKGTTAFTDYIGMSAPASSTASNTFAVRSGERTSVSDLPELPGALRELTQIKDTLALPSTELILNTDASETAFKQLSKSKSVSPNTLMVLATHGFAAVEIDGVAEPALLFAKDPQNDGILSASEIASLSLPSGMVVLSACESGSSGFGLNEGLSGLASAFLNAGAQSLLVSHWQVRDDAAAFLTTETVKSVSLGQTKAEALRTAMLKLRKSKDIKGAEHPALWGSFSFVGHF